VVSVGVGQSESHIAEVAHSVVVVQPGSGDALQFLKSGIMEIPDVLVVTKADLGDIALRARRDLHAALRSLGEKETAVVAVSSIAPATGIDDLVSALDAHRTAIDLGARRLEARRTTALAEYVAEHGERGLRAVGGRRSARTWLEAQPEGADIPALVAGLEGQAGR
jgi:LAO/AO transport system kinase